MIKDQGQLCPLFESERKAVNEMFFEESQLSVDTPGFKRRRVGRIHTHTLGHNNTQAALHLAA
jgi:hypothetical protein